MITLKHIVTRVISSSCYVVLKASLLMFDGASYAVLKFVCTEGFLETPLVNVCSFLHIFGHGVRSSVSLVSKMETMRISF